MTAEAAFSGLCAGQAVDHDVLCHWMLPDVGRNTDDRISISRNGVDPLGVIKSAGGDRSMRAAEYRELMRDVQELRVEWLSGDYDDQDWREVRLSRFDADTWCVVVAD